MTLTPETKMQATVDYAMFIANLETVHSISRIEELNFEKNPFLEHEINYIRNQLSEVYKKWNSKKGNTKGQKTTDSKFGNCDQLSNWVINAFNDCDYNAGGFGKIYLLNPDKTKQGHALNYITLGERVVIVDAWKNISFDLSQFKDFYSEYCYKEKDKNNTQSTETDEQQTTDAEKYSNLTLHLHSNKYSDTEVIDKLMVGPFNTGHSMQDSLEAISKTYNIPEDNNMLKKPKDNTF